MKNLNKIELLKEYKNIDTIVGPIWESKIPTNKNESILYIDLKTKREKILNTLYKKYNMNLESIYNYIEA